MHVDGEAAVGAAGLRRPLAGRGQLLVQQLRGGVEHHAADQRAQPGLHGTRPDGGLQAAADAHDFAVAEALAVADGVARVGAADVGALDAGAIDAGVAIDAGAPGRSIQQRGGAAHDAGVVRRHEKRREAPGLAGVDLFAGHDRHVVLARRPRPGHPGVQRIRRPRDARAGLVGADVLELLPQRIDGAPGQSAAHVGDHERRLSEVAVAGLRGGVVKHLDPDVRRDRIEPARVDDARAGGLRQLVVGGDGVVGEEDLAGQVDVVGAGGGAGVGQRVAVAGVGPDEGEHHARGFGEVAHVGLGGGVGDDERPVGGGRRGPAVGGGRPGEFVAQGRELRAVAAGQGDRGSGGRVRGKVLCDELAHEPRGPEHHDVVGAAGAVRIVFVPSHVPTLTMCGVSRGVSGVLL